MHESNLEKAKALGHELEGVDVRWIWLFTAALVALVIVALALMWGIIRGFAAYRGADEAEPVAQVPMAAGMPELDANQVVEMRRLRALENALLHSYEMVDPAARIARVPIERAIAIAAEKGLGAISAAEASASDPSTATTVPQVAPSPAVAPDKAPATDEPSPPNAPTDE